tara:strand:- start:727 stop:1860 length:1134 start_codon:yes stop_codon:yes gene_type:complete
MKHLIWYDTEFFHGIFQKLIHIDKFERYHKEIYEYGLMTAAPNQPVMDMTGEKHFGFNVRIIKNNIPNYEEVNVGSDVIPLLEKKAKEVCSLGRQVDILWSGGLDSTTTLLLLRDFAEKDQLRIIMSEGSIDEYPWLYDTLVQHMPHVVNREMDIRSEMKREHITVNANMADLMYHGSLGDHAIGNGPLKGDFSLCPVEYRTKTYWKLKYMWQQKNLQHLSGYLGNEVVVEDDYVPAGVSLFDDRDVLQWYINKHIRNELPLLRQSWEFLSGEIVEEYRQIWEMLPPEGRMCQTKDDAKDIPIADSYLDMKMEFRNYIAHQTGDKEYAYNKPKVASYSHGQKNMYDNTYPTVAVCDDGSVIKRDQLSSIDPFDFVSP